MSFGGDRCDPGGALFEFYRVGSLVKVSAVDPVTMTEVCIQGSALMEEQYLRQAAARKLRYVLNRRMSKE